MPTIIDVTVTTIGSTHSLTVLPDPATIPSGVRGPIQWRITNAASEGWKFQEQGIDIVSPGTEFDRPNGGGMRVFTWNNNHTHAGTYKYAVRVTNNSSRVEVDPKIVNQ